MNEHVIEIKKMKESFFAAKMRNFNLRFCVIENTERKEYLVLDSENDFEMGFCIPFGGIVSNLLNSFIKLNPNSVHHNDFKANLLEYGQTFSDEDIINQYNLRSKDIDQLIRIIKQRDTFKYPDKIALKCAYIRDWKKYRHIFCEDWDGLESEENHLHKVTEKSFIYYDLIYFDYSGEWTYGNVWFAELEANIFPQDLYHVMVDNSAKLPRFCPRCGLMYYSNNNKSKYCPECKKQSNDIRKENIKKNPTRYLHKRVWDKINAHKDKYDKDFLNAFMNESNYYWHNISGKPSDLQRLDSYQNIDTIEK